MVRNVTLIFVLTAILGGCASEEGSWEIVDGGIGSVDTELPADVDGGIDGCRYDVCDDTAALPEVGLLNVWVDFRFSNFEAGIIERSLIDYNWAAERGVYAIMGFVDVDEYNGSDPLFVRSEQSDGQPLGRTYVNGLYNDSVYLYAKNLGTEVDWIATVKHEIVHLGDGRSNVSEHTDDPNDVMFMRYRPSNEVTHYSENDKRIIRDSVSRRFGN